MDYDSIFPKALAKLFPAEDARAEVEAILSEYGTEKFHREVPRIKTAILKAAGANPDEVKRWHEPVYPNYIR